MGLLDFWRPAPTLAPEEKPQLPKATKNRGTPAPRLRQAPQYTKSSSTTYQSWADTAVSGASAKSFTGKGTVADGFTGGYSTNPWAYACAHKIAVAAGSVPWRVQRRTGRKVELVEESTELERLIENPNPNMSRQHVIQTMVLWLLLGGNGILFKEMNGGAKTKQLWPVNPDQVQPLKDEAEFIRAYELSTPSFFPVKRGTYDKNKIIHAMYVNPINPYWGMSPYQVASGVVDSNNQAIEWNRLSYSNRLNPDGVVSVEENLGQLQYDLLRQQMVDGIQGSANAHLPLLLGSGAKYTPTAKTPIDMDFSRGLQLTREDVCAIFEVPPPVAGDLSRATYSNIAVAWRIFWNVPVKHALDALAGVFNVWLAPEFQEPNQPGTLELTPAFEEIPELRTISKEVAEVVRIFHERGIPFETLNRRFGLKFPAFEGWDTGFMQSSVATVETIEDDDGT